VEENAVQKQNYIGIMSVLIIINEYPEAGLKWSLISISVQRILYTNYNKNKKAQLTQRERATAVHV